MDRNVDGYFVLTEQREGVERFFGFLESVKPAIQLLFFGVITSCGKYFGLPAPKGGHVVGLSFERGNSRVFRSTFSKHLFLVHT